MSPKLNVGLLLPARWTDRMPPVEQLTAFCQRAEELGFHSLWVIDRVFPRPKMNVPHPLTVLTYVAASTRRIGLGTATLLLSLRHPVDVAQQAATLDAMAGGRLTLGVALGGRDEEYVAMNMPKRQRAGRLEEGMTVLRKLWTETDVTFHGRYYDLEHANVTPKPSRPGGIPVGVGANAEPAIRRAGRIADGWIAGGTGTPERFARGWQMAQEGAREAGRDPSTLANWKLLYVNVDDDRERAGRELQAYMDAYYGAGFHALEGETAFGAPQQVAQEVRAYAEVGCQTVMLGLPSFDVAKLDRLAAEVIPALE